jgi:hypothetical protein
LRHQDKPSRGQVHSRLTLGTRESFRLFSLNGSEILPLHGSKDRQRRKTASISLGGAAAVLTVAENRNATFFNLPAREMVDRDSVLSVGFLEDDPVAMLVLDFEALDMSDFIESAVEALRVETQEWK